MNIFYLDNDPVVAAKSMSDKHIVKMILESAQMLSTAHRVLDDIPNEIGVFYKKTHYNHPCSKWVRESQDNYFWLYRHFLALCQEYRNRYGKIHETERKLGNVLDRYPNNLITRGFTSPALAMPDEYKVEDNPIQSYRNYYEAEKLKKEKDIVRYKELLRL